MSEGIQKWMKMIINMSVFWEMIGRMMKLCNNVQHMAPFYLVLEFPCSNVLSEEFYLQMTFHVYSLSQIGMSYDGIYVAT